MTTTYRLTVIDSAGVERDAGLLGTLNTPPGCILVMSVSRDTLDTDLHRLRQEWREMTSKLPEWEGRTTIIIRAGDVSFAALVPVEVPG